MGRQAPSLYWEMVLSEASGLVLFAMFLALAAPTMPRPCSRPSVLLGSQQVFRTYPLEVELAFYSQPSSWLSRSLKAHKGSSGGATGLHRKLFASLVGLSNFNHTASQLIQHMTHPQSTLPTTTESLVCSTRQQVLVVTANL